MLCVATSNIQAPSGINYKKWTKQYETHAWRRRHLLKLLHCLGTRTNVRTHTLYNINSLLYKKEYERNLGTENCPNGSRYRIVTINISPKELLPFNCILFLLLRSTWSRARGSARSPTRSALLEWSRMIWMLRERRTVVSSHSLGLTLNKTRDLFSIESIALVIKYYMIVFWWNASNWYIFESYICLYRELFR